MPGRKRAADPKSSETGIAKLMAVAKYPKRMVIRTTDGPAKEWEPGTTLTLRDIELRTRGQAKNPEWHNARRGRITASKVGSILASYRARKQYTRAKTVRKQNLANDIVFPGPSKDNVEAIKWGTEHEMDALSEYHRIKQLGDNETLYVGAGLYVHPEHPWLACSPDGLYVKDCQMGKRDDGTWDIMETANPEYIKKLVEVKCPYSKRESGDFDDPKFYLKKAADGSKYELNMASSQGRQYYEQIQTALCVLDYQLCDLVVWTPARTEIVSVQRQMRLSERTMIETLHDFYKDYVKPIIDPETYWNTEEPQPGAGDIIDEMATLSAKYFRRLKAMNLPKAGPLSPVSPRRKRARHEDEDGDDDSDDNDCDCPHTPVTRRVRSRRRLSFDGADAEDDGMASDSCMIDDCDL
jgi:hypothetical protein